MDEKVFNELKKINKGNTEESLYPEHDFYVSCLRIGLSLNDLHFFTYIDILKIFISYIGKTKETNGSRKATQEEIQNLVARM